MGKLAIYTSGANGSTLFSMYDENRKPIYIDKKLEDFCDEMINDFPDICLQISDHRRHHFAIDLPKNLDLYMDPTKKKDFIEKIYDKREQIKKV